MECSNCGSYSHNTSSCPDFKEPQEPCLEFKCRYHNQVDKCSVRQDPGDWWCSKHINHTPWPEDHDSEPY